MEWGAAKLLELPHAGHRRRGTEFADAAKLKDFRGYPPEVAQRGAARASVNAIAVTLFGNDLAKLKAIQQAIDKLAGTGWPVGLVLADARSSQIEVYVQVNGYVIFSREGVPGTVVTHVGWIQELIVGSYNRYREAFPEGSNNPQTRQLVMSAWEVLLHSVAPDVLHPASPSAPAGELKR